MEVSACRRGERRVPDVHLGHLYFVVGACALGE
jgi:hypothetical protein